MLNSRLIGPNIVGHRGGKMTGRDGRPAPTEDNERDLARARHRVGTGHRAARGGHAVCRGRRRRVFAAMLRMILASEEGSLDWRCARPVTGGRRQHPRAAGRIPQGPFAWVTQRPLPEGHSPRKEMSRRACRRGVPDRESPMPIKHRTVGQSHAVALPTHHHRDPLRASGCGDPARMTRTWFGAPGRSCIRQDACDRLLPSAGPAIFLCPP